MKRLIAMMLVLVMIAALAAGCKKENAAQLQEDADQTETMNVTALEVLENTWNAHAEDETFPVYGGEGENMVDGAPGMLLDQEGIEAQLLLPADGLADTIEVAGLFHGMMPNNFTAGAFKLKEGVDAKEFADMMYAKVMSNQWICGFPEKLMIAVVEGDCVVVVFGLESVVDTFQTRLTETYPNAQVAHSEAIM